jgi:hypothetical protein
MGPSQRPEDNHWLADRATSIDDDSTLVKDPYFPRDESAFAVDVRSPPRMRQVLYEMGCAASDSVTLTIALAVH